MCIYIYITYIYIYICNIHISYIYIYILQYCYLAIYLDSHVYMIVIIVTACYSYTFTYICIYIYIYIYAFIYLRVTCPSVPLCASEAARHSLARASASASREDLVFRAPTFELGAKGAKGIWGLLIVKAGQFFLPMIACTIYLFFRVIL